MSWEIWVTALFGPAAVVAASYCLNKKLKDFEGQRGKDIKKLQTLLNRGLEIHAAAAPKRIEGVAAIWHTTILARRKLPSILYLFDESNNNGWNLYSLEDRRKLVFHSSSFECEEVFDNSEVDLYRYSVPAELYELFEGYRTFILSVLSLSRTNFPKDDCPWYIHKETLQLLQKHIPSHLNDIMARKKGRLRMVLKALEDTIDKACRAAISGEADSNEYAGLLREDKRQTG